MPPILSICLPTYNRASLLDGALRCLVPQVRAAGGTVELVISDNASTDHTQKLGMKCADGNIIRYSRNNENIGLIGNCLHLTNTLARGEYGWIVGDDDVVSADAVTRVLGAITASNRATAIFLNHAYEDIALHDNYLQGVLAEDIHTTRGTLCAQRSDQDLTRWEDALLLSRRLGAGTSLVCHVFKLEAWRPASRPICARVAHNKFLSDFSNTFFHVEILAEYMVGSRAYYVGHPCVILFVGAQEWFRLWPGILFAYGLEYTDMLAARGASRAVVNHYRDVLFREGRSCFNALFLKPEEAGRGLVSMKKLMLRYGLYPAFLGMLAGSARSVVGAKMRAQRCRSR